MQKTAYEMRMSDWSSDVCSSDLKAQAESLRRTREETPAKKLAASGSEATETVPSSALRKGDLFICEAGDTVPADGEFIERLATIDESAITGESRSDERRRGKAGISQCQFRWSQFP